MKEITGDIWDYRKQGYVVVTTNGFVKANGDCVMGRGIALQARNRFKGLAKALGTKINEGGNRVHVFESYKIITFPVKEVWWEPAKQWLIQRSCQQLLNCLNDRTDKAFIPHAGCQNGKLDWETQVKPIFEQEFGNDDRIIVVTYG